MQQPSHSSTPVLEARGLTRLFGPFVAVDNVSLTVARGQAHAVIGPNGAGKTTLFHLFSGHLRPSRGHVFLNGVPVTGWPAHVIARHGVARSYQTTNIFPSLTVQENVEAALLALEGRTLRFWQRVRPVDGERAMEYLRLVGLQDQADRPAGILAYGDQRALEVAVALARQPHLLLLDEPTAGMSPYETQKTVELLRTVVRDHGVTLLLSEHDMEVVFNLADVITVMEAGRVIASGPPAAVRRDPNVIRAYLGDLA